MNRATLSVLLSFAVDISMANSLTPASFAYGVTLETAGAGPVFEVGLPRSVYERITRSDLGDIRVFNNRDEVVPHALRRPDARPAIEARVLTHFPIRCASTNRLDDLVLQVERNRAGAIVNVRSTQNMKTDDPIVAWLADTGDDDRPWRAIELDWSTQSPGGFSGMLRVDIGNDLKSWRVIAGAAPVVQLRHDGHLLDRRRIEFDPVRGKYLRLSWVGSSPEAVLTTFKIEHAQDAVLTRETIELSPARSGDRPGEYLFTIPGQIPVEQVEVRLPELNAVAHADLLSRKDRRSGWRLRASGLAYRLMHNEREIINEALTVVGAATDREWLLRMSQREGGLGKGSPKLAVTWTPHSIVFVGRGGGPFRLAYGGAGLTPGDHSLDQLLRDFGSNKNRKMDTSSATIGGELELGGPERLHTSLSMQPWHEWLMWAGLALGVVFLGWMALRLARQLQMADKKPD